MKVLNKKSKSIIFLLVFLIPVIALSSISASGILERDFSVYEMSFVHAEYLDADGDGLEDDTRFSVYTYFNPEFFDGSIIRLDCNFEIILPSGITFYYHGFIRMNSVSCTIQIDAFNTVSEPGWYTINFSSYVKIYNVKFTCFCTTIFDPPTGHPEGGGTPTIGL
ncbi:MAG: hypothetical protein ACTSSB_07500 [Candidatus Heimdallarchaeota archaeon]